MSSPSTATSRPIPAEPLSRTRLKEVALFALLGVLFLGPRLPGIAAFTTIDEPFWLHQSSNFYYALGQREFANTMYAHHPAVTTMWIITAALLFYFPQYRALQQGYLKPGKFEGFLASYGKTPLELLEISRLIQVLVVVALLFLVFLLMRRLFGLAAAVLPTGMISVSPVFLGHSRVLNHEALLGLFLLVSMLCLQLFLSERRWQFLAISAVAAGLAQLSKSSGLPLVPLGAVMILFDAVTPRSGKPGRPLLDAARTLGVWLAVMVATYVVFWPGMWVTPGRLLYEVYGNVLSYAFVGTTLEVLPGLDASTFRVGGFQAGLSAYLAELAWRTPPVTWLGVVAALILLVAGIRATAFRIHRRTVIYSMALAAAFVLMFSVQRGRKPPHYILTTFMLLDLIAGLGFARALALLVPRLPARWMRAASFGTIAFIVGAGLLSSARSYPYYFTHYNHVTELLLGADQNPILDGTGYGAGLEQAAAFLRTKPDAAKMTVLSVNGAGAFSYYFPGETITMNALDVSDPVILGLLPTADYAVVDYYNQSRSGVLLGLTQVVPEKIISIEGIPFLHIYSAGDILANVRPGRH
jgi:hypothetical protein